MSKPRFTEAEKMEALVMQLPGPEARELFERIQRVMYLRNLIKMPRKKKLPAREGVAE